MSRHLKLLLSLSLWLGLSLGSDAFAASSNVNSLTGSPAIVNGQLFYCPIGATTDYKCTAAQVAAYTYSLMTGDCTETGLGVITCLKTNAVAFSGLATLAGSAAGDIAYWNGSAWVRLAGNASGTNILQETASGVPSWVANASSAAIPVVAKSSAYTVLSTDVGTLFQVTGTTTLTQPALSVGAGFNECVINADTTLTTTVSGGGNNIFSGGVSAGAVTLTPGQTMCFAMNAAVSGWLGSTGPAGPTGAAGPAAATGPGYVAGVYVTSEYAISATPIGVTTITTAYCAPIWINTIAGGTGTLGNLYVKLSGAGTTTESAAIYANNPATNRPTGSALVTGTASTVTGQPPIPMITPAAISLSSNTMSWACYQGGDTANLRYYEVQTGTNLPFSAYARLVGSTTVGSYLLTGLSTTTGISSYATWPSFTSATWTETTGVVPLFQYDFSSIP